MDKEEIETMMQHIVKDCRLFYEAKTYEKAQQIDQEISVLRFLIGESNFLPLHYFRTAHEEVVKYIGEYKKLNEKVNKTDNTNN